MRAFGGEKKLDPPTGKHILRRSNVVKDFALKSFFCLKDYSILFYLYCLWIEHKESWTPAAPGIGSRSRDTAFEILVVFHFRLFTSQKFYNFFQNFHRIESYDAYIEY